MDAPPGRGQLIEGEEGKSFSCAYRSYADELYRFCLRQTGDRALAEEVSATVFLEAWRRYEEVDFSSRPIRPWLYGVARNVLRNQRRAQLRQEEAIRDLGQLNRRYADDPSEELARREVTCALVCSLESLTEGQRQVVNLCLLGDSSYEAAAGDLEVPVGTVRSRLARARLNLTLAVRAASGA
jgi:RNA polymerase sigma factor (sigma-70 family)